MHEINKIKILHDLKQGFKISQDEIEKYVSQIEKNEYRDNIQRFFDGFKIEDHFFRLFSFMPWVKLIHGLDQEQLPLDSKEEYQVPDFNIYFETSKQKADVFFVDVKHVRGGKENLNIIRKQFEACEKYSNIINVNILYAIYWEKIHTWTINSPDSFDIREKELRINYLDAFQNDLSVIVGDVSYIFIPFYRKSICNPTIKDSFRPINSKYGTVLKDSISVDDNKYIELEPLESALIDSTIKMKEIECKRINGNFIIKELNENFYYIKLSSLIMNIVSLFNFELNEDRVLPIIVLIDMFMEKFKFSYSYQIPKDKTEITDKYFKKAFYKTWIWDKYVNQ